VVDRACRNAIELEANGAGISIMARSH
jgi:hypothetical protein